MITLKLKNIRTRYFFIQWLLRYVYFLNEIFNKLSMCSKLAYIFMACSFLVNTSYGQEPNNVTPVFPQYISISFGTGMLSVKDFYFSNQKYTGNLPSTSIKWMHTHNKYCYRLGLNFRHSDNITNYTMPSSVTQFSLYQSFLYSLGNLHLFDNDVFIYLGPSTDIYLYFNQQQFAESGIYFNFSFLAMLSVGTEALIYMPITKKWSVESNLNLNITSLGLQTPEIIVDNDEEAESAIKFLTAFNGLKTGFNLGVRYYIRNRLSAGISYDLEISNVTVREKIFTVNDNLIGSLAYHF